jgi:hypothetical protein
MNSNRPRLRLIAGRRAEPRADRIVLSLVHPRGRVDVPARAIVRVEAQTQGILPDRESGTWVVVRGPRVAVFFTQPIRNEIFLLTQQIVGEVLEIVVDGACISRPVVREPLGAEPAFFISAYEITEARVLAHRLRTGTRSGPKPVL